MPDAFVDKQILLIDIQKSENAIVNQIRARIRHELLQRERGSFAKVKAVPDHRSDGLLVQMAYIAAGALTSDEWLDKRCPSQLKSNIRII